MLGQRIDGVLSRTVHTLADCGQSTDSPVVLDAGLDLAGRAAGFLARKRKSSRARIRWCELRNKIAAYHLFEGRNHAGHRLNVDEISALHPYPRMFAAEGYSYRSARQEGTLRALPPELNSISVHAGCGLWFAEQMLKNLKGDRSDLASLAVFRDVCRQKAVEGFRGIMEEALGLVARTLYPHLMNELDVRLREVDKGLWERFWHGVGRGIYFAPSNFPPFRAVPWSGVSMCLNEAPDETARDNALSGFAFAVTLVNLQQPEVLNAFFQNHAAAVAGLKDGVQAAISAWRLSAGYGEINENPAYVPSAAGTRGLDDLLQQCAVSHEDCLQPERLFVRRQPATGCDRDNIEKQSPVLETAAANTSNARYPYEQWNNSSPIH